MIFGVFFVALGSLFVVCSILSVWSVSSVLSVLSVIQSGQSVSEGGTAAVTRLRRFRYVVRFSFWALALGALALGRVGSRSWLLAGGVLVALVLGRSLLWALALGRVGFSSWPLAGGVLAALVLGSLL